jgi:hypothetical protein
VAGFCLCLLCESEGVPRRIGSRSLGEFPFDVVRIDCERCGRTGSYALAGLLARLGTDAAGPDVLMALALCQRRSDRVLVRADGALSEAASPVAVAFEAARSAPMARGFGLPTIMRCVPAPSNQGTQQRRVGRSSASGILPIWTSRRLPSGVLSPLQCRRELIPIPPGQGLCQASAQSFGRAATARAGNYRRDGLATAPSHFLAALIFLPVPIVE